MLRHTLIGGRVKFRWFRAPATKLARQVHDLAGFSYLSGGRVGSLELRVRCGRRRHRPGMSSKPADRAVGQGEGSGSAYGDEQTAHMPHGRLE
jgi:hypothetical protein